MRSGGPPSADLLAPLRSSAADFLRLPEHLGGGKRPVGNATDDQESKQGNDDIVLQNAHEWVRSVPAVGDA